MTQTFPKNWNQIGYFAPRRRQFVSNIAVVLYPYTQCGLSGNPSQTDVSPPRSPSPDPIALEVEQLRESLYEWRSWCPARSHWDTEFDLMKTSSYENGEHAVELFWEWCKVHIDLGNETLDCVKVLVQTVSDNSTQLPPGSIVDLYQITVELAMEVTYVLWVQIARIGGGALEHSKQFFYYQFSQLLKCPRQRSSPEHVDSEQYISHCTNTLYGERPSERLQMCCKW